MDEKQNGDEKQKVVKLSFPDKVRLLDRVRDYVGRDMPKFGSLGAAAEFFGRELGLTLTESLVEAVLINGLVRSDLVDHRQGTGDSKADAIHRRIDGLERRIVELEMLVEDDDDSDDDLGE